MNGDHLLEQAVQRVGSRKFHLAAGVAIVLMIMAMSPRALAQVITMGPSTETLMGNNPCTGEDFFGTGKTFLLIYPRFDALGGVVHFTFRTMSHVDAQTVLT